MGRNRGKPWRTVDVGGYELLIGRGAAGNVELTRSVRAGDWWLHVADGYAGSHGVVRCQPGGAIGPAVLYVAARYVAWHSAARQQESVNVYQVRVEADGGIPVDDDGTAQIAGFVATCLTPVPPLEPPVTPGPGAQPPGPNELQRAVGGALRACIGDHGPIDAQWVPSATKRVLGALRPWIQEEWRER